jgi:hypothetical protein
LTHSDSLYSKWVVLSLNLHGDPEMPVWTRAPRRIKLPQTKPVAKKWEWPILDELRRPIPDAVVTAVIDGVTYRAIADRHGIAGFDAELPAGSVEAEVTITAPATSRSSARFSSRCCRPLPRPKR